MKKFVTIVDPQGATLGYGGPDVAISHSVLFENKVFYGFESVQKLFAAHQALIDFLVHCVALPYGSSGVHNSVGRELRWSVTDKPTSSFGSGSVEVLTDPV
jgi:hypothetical protein